MRKSFGWMTLALLGTVVIAPRISEAQTAPAPAAPPTAPAPAAPTPAAPVAATEPGAGSAVEPVFPGPTPEAQAMPAPATEAAAPPAPVPPAPATTEAPMPAAPAAAAPEDGGEQKPAWKKKPDVVFSGFVHALYTWQSGNDLANNEFRIRNARLEATWNHGKLLEAEISFDLGDEEQTLSEFGPLRDAYVEVKPLDALRFRAGQFKKPFSRLELTSLAKLRPIERGVANAWIVDRLGYGDRDIGAEVYGRFGELPRLNYAVGVFNGSGRNAAEDDLNGSKDAVARVDADIVEWLNVGAGVSYKHFDQDVQTAYPKSGLMGGADFAIEPDKLHIVGEAMYGQNYLSLDEGKSWAALLLASYEIPLTTRWDLALEPLAKGEIVKIQDQVEDSHVWVGTAGANLHIAKYFRLMVQGEMIRPELAGEQEAADRILPDWPRENRLLVQAAMRAP